MADKTRPQEMGPAREAAVNALHAAANQMVRLVPEDPVAVKHPAGHGARVARGQHGGRGSGAAARGVVLISSRGLGAPTCARRRALAAGCWPSHRRTPRADGAVQRRSRARGLAEGGRPRDRGARLRLHLLGRSVSADGT
jgi:hypothetical protein